MHEQPIRFTAHPDADVDRYQVDVLPGDDRFITTTQVAGLAIYVRQAPNGTILVDVDHETAAPGLIVSVDDVTYYNDEPTT